MAKRFTDSEKWKKPWFRKLTPIQKCFWVYLLDQCDQAGFWAVDFDLAGIFIGEEVNEQEMREVFKKQYTELDNGKKWFIQDFIDFQYGELKETNRLHVFVLRILEKQGVSIPLTQLAYGAKDKDKDKVKDKDKEKEGIVKGIFKKPTLEELSQALRSGGLEAALSNDEAQKFLDYYESVGWVVGRTRKPMKNWRGAISTWIKNRRAWEAERKTSERPNPMNLNKKQLANAEALNDFLERKRSTRPGGVRQGDGVALLGVSIPELES